MSDPAIHPDTTSPPEARPGRPRSVRGVPFAALVALVTYWGLVTWASVASSAVSPRNDLISQLSAPGAPRAGLMLLASLLLTVATGLLAWALNEAGPALGSRALVVRALLVGAVGSLGTVLLRANEDDATILSGGVVNFFHQAAQGLFFVAVLAAMGASLQALRATGRNRALVRITMVLGALAGVALLCTAALLPDHPWVGLAQRVVLGAETAWMAMLALRLS